MTLFKRHIGRRVVGVGVGVALLMLGLAAPAWAAPTISAISPTNGPNACVVVVTGTGFTEFPEAQTTVDFMDPVLTAVPQANFSVIDATTIWVGVSGLTVGTSYTVRVTNPGTPAGVTSTATFLATTAAGGCAPTITSFTPTCGAAGTTVVITGTNLIDATDLAGADVYFSPYDTALPLPSRLAAHTVPDVDDVTSLSVVVPSTTTSATNAGTTDGPIKVITDVSPLGVFSAASFLVPPPDCVPVGPATHARSVTLSLRKHLVARGKVSVGDAFTDCAAAVPVKIQRRVSGHWKTVGSTTTSDTGAYNKRIRDRAGKYRAKATQVSLGTPVTDICSGARSPVRRVS